MRDDATLPESTFRLGAGADDDQDSGPALLMAWCPGEPERTGEIVLLHPHERPYTVEIGRGAGPAEEGRERAAWVRQRPGRNRTTPPLGNPRISRVQLTVDVEPTGEVTIRREGRLPLRVDGRDVASTRFEPGRVVVLGRQAVLLCVRRPAVLTPLQAADHKRLHDFGAADPDGIVGESPQVWALRDRVAFTGAVNAHVLISGPTGAGKELVARAVHSRSPRGRRPMVARNAATIPDGLADAELFGNLPNYPNPGMPARPGLVGEADGSTLFLDEIAELPETQQARLLRVLDSGGEYHRLGESRARRADLRLIGATNRPLGALKHDVLARFKLRVEVGPLAGHIDDLPLLVRHLLGQAALDDGSVRRRFFDEGDPTRSRVDCDLVAALLTYDWPHNVRELDTVLWRSMASSPDDTLRLTDEVAGAITHVVEAPTVDPADLTPERIAAALDACDHVQERAWRELGLKNRYQLIRLIKKHGLRKGAGDDAAG